MIFVFIFALQIILLLVICGLCSPIFMKLLFLRDVSIGSIFFNTTIIPVFSSITFLMMYYHFHEIYKEEWNKAIFSSKQTNNSPSSWSSVQSNNLVADDSQNFHFVSFAQKRWGEQLKMSRKKLQQSVYHFWHTFFINDNNQETFKKNRFRFLLTSYHSFLFKNSRLIKTIFSLAISTCCILFLCLIPFYYAQRYLEGFYYLVFIMLFIGLFESVVTKRNKNSYYSLLAQKEQNLFNSVKRWNSLGFRHISISTEQLVRFSNYFRMIMSSEKDFERTSKSHHFIHINNFKEKIKGMEFAHFGVLLFVTGTLLSSNSNITEQTLSKIEEPRQVLDKDWLYNFRGVDSYYGTTFHSLCSNILFDKETFGKDGNTLFSQGQRNELFYKIDEVLENHNNPAYLKNLESYIPKGNKFQVVSPDQVACLNPSDQAVCLNQIVFPELRSYFNGFPLDSLQFLTSSNFQTFPLILESANSKLQSLPIQSEIGQSQKISQLDNVVSNKFINPFFNSVFDPLLREAIPLQGSTHTQKACPSIITNLCSNFYSTIGSGSLDHGWHITIFIHPFIFCVWIGFLLATIGGLKSLSIQLETKNSHFD